YSTKTASRVTIEHYGIFKFIEPLHFHVQRLKVLFNKIYTHAQCLHIGSNKLFFAFKLFFKKVFEYVHLNIQQSAKGAYINNIFKKLALAWVAECIVTHVHQRNTKVIYIIANIFCMQHFAAVVHKVSAGCNTFHIGLHALRVYTNHNIYTISAAQIAIAIYTHFVPCRQALYVGWKYIFRRNRYAHPENGLCKQVVGTCRTRTIYVGKPYNKIVYFTNTSSCLHALGAFVTL